MPLRLEGELKSFPRDAPESKVPNSLGVLSEAFDGRKS